MALIADGKSNATIAAELNLSEHTVKRHVANILMKLDLPSRAAAAAFAVRQTGPDGP
ncbi:helix-turn-helix transcriptional regulator [Aminobacter anthyllidis]|uniref:helix-turn-helix domain-containing protein n=1 Tax=Aminobacter anthyllidis TaxID=1035067 RepID=UPI0024577D9F|nr:helix-turn-helix transcriptional regulator [Aminobacter anthyllidis]MDH4986263.1 helix-turn-helix transcriptional regulator [Aminobacter anthyllidis]